MLSEDENHVANFSYDALWRALFPRWRNGVDLDALIGLLQSDVSRDRERGAFYLDEATPPPTQKISAAAVSLADDPIGYCRMKFVAYVINSGLYNDTVSNRLAGCLLDLDLRVRAETIFWGVMAEDDQFADFLTALLSSVQSKAYRFRKPEQTAFWRGADTRRALRGIEIIKLLRRGETVPDVRDAVSGEDSLLFDFLASRRQAMKRVHDRRSACGSVTD